VDEQINPSDRGRSDETGSSGQRQDGGAVSARDGILDATESEDPGRPATSAPGSAVPLHQPAGGVLPEEWRSGVIGGHEKEELVGAFKNAGRTWRPKGDPHRVNVHDFPSLAEGKAIPYGAYGIGADRAVVNVGITHDTAEFAVESIRRWWKLSGRKRKQRAKRILICADAGGSNSSRSRAWKLHLQDLVDELGIPITVCHYPPGTSKWNKIEHRLFSFISLTWKGQPLVNYETVVNLIGATRTKSGLRVKAVLDTNEYETGKKVTKSQMESLRIRRHKNHPDWNYALEPRV